ncbi:hypothetical protein OUZ56_031174 [Daphnia magna]|uniref:Uncharacterized protein n=1 Tax=Daphnia magna TaxID=35525 RepID=A0ABQ9ZTU6_9CRUS|nr:hypothetical protein OUZ56_031174 [Daphnia magna]
MASLQLIQSVGDFQSKHNGLLRLVTHVFTSRICIACFDLSSCVITDGIDPSALYSDTATGRFASVPPVQHDERCKSIGTTANSSPRIVQPTPSFTISSISVRDCDWPSVSAKVVIYSEP